MNSLILEALKEPEKLDSYVQDNWRKIVLSAVKEIQKLVVKRKLTMMKTLDIPLPVEETAPAQLNVYFAPHAMVAGGVWVDKALSDDNRRTVYIYWPRMLSTLALMPTAYPVDMGSTGLMVWGFSEIFRRRSILFYEFLRRRFLNAMALHAGVDDFEEKVPQLTSTEQSVFGNVSGTVLKPSDPMIKSLRESFKLTMERTSPRIYSTRPSRQIKDLRPDVLQGCSVWHTELFKYWESVVLERFPKPVIHIPKGNHFNPDVRDEMLREALFVRGVPADGRVIFGIRRSGKILPEERVTLVDLGEFARYRTSTGNTLYQRLRKKLKKPTASWRQLAGEMVFQFYEKNPMFRAPRGDYSKFYDFIKDVFPSANVDHILFLPYGGIMKKLQYYKQTEAAREAAPRKFHAPRRACAVIIESDPIASAGNEVFRFKIIKRNNRTYFCPPWDIPHAAIIAPATQQREFRRGVYYDYSGHTAYCTHTLLLNMDNSPLKMHPQLNVWLSNYADLSRTRYKELQELTRKSFVEASERNEGHRARYTAEEDQAICRYYKPTMTEADKSILLRICKGREWIAIRTRATYLCRKYLKAGCTNINELPYKNYNAALRRKIADNVAAAKLNK